MQVGVDIEGLPNQAPDRNGLQAHQAVAVVHADEVMSVGRDVGRTANVPIRTDHTIRHAVHNQLGAHSTGRVWLTVDEVIAAQVSVGQGLWDAVVLSQTDVLHVRSRLQVNLMQRWLILVEDDSKSTTERTNLGLHLGVTIQAIKCSL